MWGVSHCQSPEQLLPYSGVDPGSRDQRYTVFFCLLCSRYRPGAPSSSSHSVSAWWQTPHFITKETGPAQWPFGEVDLGAGKLEWELGNANSERVWFLDCIYLKRFLTLCLEGGIQG